MNCKLQTVVSNIVHWLHRGDCLRQKVLCRDGLVLKLIDEDV